MVTTPKIWTNVYQVKNISKWINLVPKHKQTSRKIVYVSYNSIIDLSDFHIN